ncbi:MarR family winged helix-turn-helix transcriptional regulator [Kineococcus rhizosphaerae]|uniref:DNA-binding MarR family transcriptional regulator n=1 Tax=Kineococcus rhizosphaerae TaxID=559628 RepID=A0A2T0R0Q6_9ACTN|nr:MarR family transcriptional regulator [Kineococcus rhizosphaerae]PRY12831.1 DNA-binding MarR family transcriptional regulator [Kineococcus rhizosphaerae]
MPPTADDTPAPDTGAGVDVAVAPLDQLAVDLRVSLLRTARRLRAQKSVDELTDGQFSVLSQLFNAGPRTPGELAEAEHVRPPSMTRTIASLVEAGLVARTDHPDDGRQVLVSPTEAGRRVVLETRERRAAWLSRRLEDLSPADRATLAEAARILNAVIGA